jgi:hypothetical protein
VRWSARRAIDEPWPTVALAIRTPRAPSGIRSLALPRVNRRLTGQVRGVTATVIYVTYTMNCVGIYLRIVPECSGWPGSCGPRWLPSMPGSKRSSPPCRRWVIVAAMKRRRPAAAGPIPGRSVLPGPAWGVLSAGHLPANRRPAVPTPRTSVWRAADPCRAGASCRPQGPPTAGERALHRPLTGITVVVLERMPSP